jgi:hypothetical protein
MAHVLNAIVTATFGEAMNPSTINVSTFTLTGPNGASVLRAVTYNFTSNTASFTPSNNLTPGLTYTATIYNRRPRPV